MRPVQILTDSCSDMPKDLRDKYSIDYCHMRTVYQGKETDASLDWEYYTPKELYDTIRKGNRVLTTQVPTEEFNRVFTKYLEQGMDIVYIGCSLKQSSSVNTGTMEARKLSEKYPEAQIFCIDAMNACMGEGLLAMRAAEYRDKGMDAKAINDQILLDRKNVNQYVTVNTLDHLKKAGRVKASAAFFGNLLGVKPILIAEKNGYQSPIKKVKGRETSLNEIVSLMKASIVDPENQTIHIVHADCEADALKLKEMVKKEIPCKDVYISYIGPIIGASIGPEAIGLYAWGQKVTFEAV